MMEILANNYQINQNKWAKVKWITEVVLYYHKYCFCYV
jgi:hypothetical protein